MAAVFGFAQVGGFSVGWEGGGGGKVGGGGGGACGGAGVEGGPELAEPAVGGLEDPVGDGGIGGSCRAAREGAGGKVGDCGELEPEDAVGGGTEACCIGEAVGEEGAEAVGGVVWRLEDGDIAARDVVEGDGVEPRPGV